MRVPAAMARVRSLLAVLSLLSWSLSAPGAVPSSIDFQAFLIGPDGAPLNGATPMRFSIYDVEVGGEPLWSDGLEVNVVQGLLSVTLGRAGNPLPRAAFRARLYLGIIVEGDAEMSPRRAINAVGFALKADDADTLAGHRARDLDQSPHLANRTNPHAVTAAQVGAATPADLASFQQRVSGSCPAGESIRVVNQDGSVACEDDNNTNAESECGTGEFLDGEGECQAGTLVRVFGPLSGNTAAGFDALEATSNTTFNTAAGFRALANNTGGENTAMGAFALVDNTTGFGNTAAGSTALRSNTTGRQNTAAGQSALGANTTGVENTGLGFWALRENETGEFNTAVGARALDANVGGDRNTAIGGNSLSGATGSNNIALGFDAGSALIGGADNNILIGSKGVAGDDDTIRIGDGHTKTFMRGVYGAGPIVNGLTVVVGVDHRLGTTLSSVRYKEQVEDLDDVSARLLELRPVRFRYKAAEAEGGIAGPAVEYGLIAEEVAAVFPELVVNDETGRPHAVRYRLLSTLLLGELKKTRTALEALRRRDEQVARRLTAMEAALGMGNGGVAERR